MKENENKKGAIRQVLGPVVDVEFPAGALPPLLTALKVERKNLTLEVAQHLGDNVCRTVAMSATEALVRGEEVTNTGDRIQVPVGKEVFGPDFKCYG